jgi:hypothetical protein
MTNSFFACPTPFVADITMLTIDGTSPFRTLGWNITFSDERDGFCRIRMSSGRVFKRRRAWITSPAEADALENWLVERLSARGLFKPTVKWKTDYYGRQWLEVRRGLFWKTYIRATPARIARLSEALNLPD